MSLFSKYLVIWALLACTLAACEDSTEVGSDLLGSEDLELVQESNFNLKSFTEVSPPLLGYFNTIVGTQLVGQLEDDIFGKITSSLYTQVSLLNQFGLPLYTNARFDSCILSLTLLRNLPYGDVNAEHKVEVFRLVEPLDQNLILTNEEFAYDPVPIGVRDNFKFSDTDSIRLFDPEANDTVIVRNVLQIPISRRFASQIFSDPDANLTNEGFKNLLDGFYIRSTTSNSMFRLSIANETFTNTLSIFYTLDEGMGRARRYDYYLTNTRPNFHIFAPSQLHDYANTEIMQQLQDSTNDDQLLYVQGLTGVNATIDLSDIKKLSEEFINYAEIEFTVATEELGDTLINPIARQLSLQTLTSNNQLVEIIDVLNARTNQQDLNRLFGGDLNYNEETQLYSYKMNITTFVKDVLKDRATPMLFLTIFNKLDNPQRTVVYGANHPVHPIKLNITYTKL